MLELMVAMSVLLIALLAGSRTLGSSMVLTEVNRETALATDAAREVVEILEGVEEFDTIFRMYNSHLDDDFGLLLPAPGKDFAVEGLQPAADDPDGFVGEILFPVNEDGSELLEDTADDDLWMPRDLDGDGDIDLLDHAENYRLLPVLLRLRWEGTSGERSMEVRTLIADR